MQSVADDQSEPEPVVEEPPEEKPLVEEIPEAWFDAMEDGVESMPGSATVVLPLKGGADIPYPFVPPKD